MATLYTDIATLQNSPSPASFTKASRLGNSSRVNMATYTLLGSEVATDVINICKLYKGDIVDISQSRVYAENPGTALVFDIGDTDTTADADRYVDGLTVSAGGWFDFTAGGTAATVALAPYEVQSECWLQLTVGTATSLTADQQIAFYVAFSSAQ